MAKGIRIAAEILINFLVVTCFSRIVFYIEILSHASSLKLYLISLATLYVIEISAFLFLDIRVSYRNMDKKVRKILKVRECLLVIGVFVIIFIILALLCFASFVIFGSWLDDIIKVICWLPNILIVHLLINILILADNG